MLVRRLLECFVATAGGPLLATFAVLAAGSAGAVTLFPGDLLVTDRNGAIVRIDPVTGAQTTVSAGGLLSDPFDVQVEASGQLLVANRGGNAILRIDPTSGAQSTLAAGFVTSGLALESDGFVLTLDNDFPEQVHRIDPGSGASALLSSGGLFQTLQGIALEASGQIVVADNIGEAVLRVDPVTGAQSIVSSGGSFDFPNDVAVGLDGTLYVPDTVTNRVYGVNPSTGVQTNLFGTPQNPVQLAVEADGNLVVVDNFERRIYRYDVVGNSLSVVSSFASPANLWGIQVVPAVVPEPGTALLLASGLGGLALRRRG